MYLYAVDRRFVDRLTRCDRRLAGWLTGEQDEGEALPVPGGPGAPAPRGGGPPDGAVPPGEAGGGGEHAERVRQRVGETAAGPDRPV